MDTENLLQINDFSGGMNTDTSDGAIASKQYRMAKNLRYVTNTQENSGELHMIEGLGDLVGTGRRVVASTQIRNIGVLVYESDNGWGVLTFKPKTKELTEVCNIQNTDRVVGQKLSLVTSYEDNNNCKLYIADGKGPIIVVQLFSGKYYTALEDVESYPSVTFTVPIYCGQIQGTLQGGVYSYSYQLYNKYSTQSEISPSTKPIPLRKGKNKGYRSDENTSCGIKIRIPTNDTFSKFEKIRIFRIRYVEVGQLPTIECVYDGPIKNNFYFEDTGMQALSLLSLEEYNSMTGIHIIPKTIESKDGYLFAANIKTDNPIYAFDSVKNWKPDVTIELTEAKIAVDNYNVRNRIDNENLTNITIPTVIGNVSAATHSNLLGVDWDIVEQSSYSNTKVSYALKSLRRGETYRFGIILYDEKGNSSAVFHIGDVTVPDGFAWELEEPVLYAKPVGVKITINNLPSEAIAYEIVRCNRGISDTKNICQGVISRPISRYLGDDGKTTTQFPLTPTGWLTTNDTVATACYWPWVSSILPGMNQSYFEDQNVLTRMVQATMSFERDDENNPSDPDEVFIWKYSATNIGWQMEGIVEISPNYNIFQFISPEYSYLEGSTKDSITQYNTELHTLGILKPQDNGWLSANNQQQHGILFVHNDYPDEVCRFKLFENGDVKVPVLYGNNDGKAGLYLSSTWAQAYAAYFPLEFGNVQYDTPLPNDYDSKYAYIKLYNNELSDKNAQIKYTAFPETLQWDDYANSDSPYQLKYTSKVTAIGDRNYVNWICGGQYDRSIESQSGIPYMDINENEAKLLALGQTGRARYGGGLEGPGGKCFIIQTDNIDETFVLNGVDDILSTYICNIQKPTIPYGGTSAQAINNSTYYSYGDYFVVGIDDTVQGGSHSVVVFDGDTFIQPFEYVSMHKYSHPAIWYPRSYFIVYSIPVETSVNLAFTYGEEFSKTTNSGNVTYIQNSASNVNGKYVQSDPLYLYNSAYSINPTYKSSVSIDREDYDYDVNLDYRIYHSLLKSNNEYVDNWLKFQPANYLDVDTRKGPITGLRRFHNKLIFWQSEATGIFSVNERTTITDDSNLPLILGTGGILARYDYLPTSNGMKLDQYCDAQSDNILYWWDHNKGEICAYQDNEGILPLSKVKFVQNYLNKVMQDGRDISDPIVSFDNNFNEAIFTISDESLVYNEHIGQFTSVYEIEPKCCMNILDDVFYVDKNDQSSIYKWNTLYNEAVYGFNGKQLTPYIKCIINKQPTYTKVFDNGEFAGRVYGGDDLSPITLKFKTPLKQFSYLNGSDIQNREYNFKYIVPRNLEDGQYPLYGGRLRGKFMQEEIESSSNSYDFSLQYIATKFRVSWS